MTAEYLDQEMGLEPVFTCNNEEFWQGKVWHWLERWDDVARKHCHGSGSVYL
jgi:hypothetical protein